MPGKSKNKQKKIIKSFTQIATIIATVIAGVILFSFTLKRELPDKKPLKVPKIAYVYLPPVLELPSVSSSILGAQAVNPKDIINFVNIERKKHGVKPLRITPTLMQAAQMRAETIIKHQNFSHQDPFENVELVTVMPKVGYHFSWASENIGMGGVSGEDFVNGFMNSTSHRENLLNPDLVDTGVAIVTGPYKQYYVNIAVQLFAIPSGKAEYLGYTKEDKRHYEKTLTRINGVLNPLGRTLNRLVGNPDFTPDQYKTFQRQKDILDSLLIVMSQEKPFTKEHADLVLEYNETLKR